MSFFLHTTVCGFTLYQILAYFLVYSCLGWCLEVVYAAATTGQIVNRGFLNGPVCPIYGFGMVIVLFVLTPFAHSTLALYIGGYICLEFSLLWGVGTLVMMKAIHPTIAGLVELVPPFIGFLLMCFLYAVYAADVVVTAVAASDLARELDALENVADSIHAVSDAMTEILGTTAMEADQKLDENRLQFKLAAAEARDAAAQLSPKEAAEAMRRKADEARDAARRASEISRLNAAEAAKAVKLAAKGTAERTAELLQLEQLAEELAARSEELRERTRRTAHFGKGRMLRAYPRLRHGTKQLTLDELRERLKYEHKHSA